MKRVNKIITKITLAFVLMVFTIVVPLNTVSAKTAVNIGFQYNGQYAGIPINAGFRYTNYNSAPVNYYYHTPNTYTQNYTYSYPQYYTQYYPQYYTQYYPQYYTPCYDNYTIGPYYESTNSHANCSDALEDWNNRYGMPNQFLTEAYGTPFYH